MASIRDHIVADNVGLVRDDLDILYLAAAAIAAPLCSGLWLQPLDFIQTIFGCELTSLPTTVSLMTPTCTVYTLHVIS